MPRANRITCPGLVWHLTHRCHRQAFLLRFARDRRRWRHWLFEATRRYRLCVLNYIATSNHVHLLVRDTANSDIPAAMQLVASRTAQEFNRRKSRRGAFWEDRYHATAVQHDGHLARCMTYIDLNMVRAGAVEHPSDWEVSGYTEIQNPRRRKRVVDLSELCSLLDEPTPAELARRLRTAVEASLESTVREDFWSGAVGVGDKDFLESLRQRLGVKVRHRSLHAENGCLSLREPPADYGSESTSKTGD